jgi:hypothetical protein
MVKFVDTESEVNFLDIEELEKKINFIFPDNYKKHLIKYNGGRCFRKLTSSFVDWFLAIYHGDYDNLEDYFVTYKIVNKRLPDTFFPFAHDPGGNLICMDTTNEHIYFWDHESEVDYNFFSDENHNNLYFIAQDFQTFLDGLTDG